MICIYIVHIYIYNMYIYMYLYRYTCIETHALYVCMYLHIHICVQICVQHLRATGLKNNLQQRPTAEVILSIAETDEPPQLPLGCS